MRITLTSILAVVVALAFVGAPANAQIDRVGTSGADQLLMPVGARGVALGGAYSAGMSGVEAIYYNPAGLASGSGDAEARFSHMYMIGDIGVDYVAVGAEFVGFGNIGLTVKSTSFGDIDVTNEWNPDGTGGTYSPTFVAVGLTYARALTDRIHAGISAYFVSETIDRVAGSTAAFDIGVQYQGLGGVRGLGLGVTLRHLGGNMQYEGSGLNRRVDEIDAKRDPQILRLETASFSLPTSLELSMAYKSMFEELHSVTFAGAFENNNFISNQYRLGVEYSFRDWLFLRGSYVLSGVNEDDVAGESAYLYGPALGAGLHYNFGTIAIGVDYAYRMTQVFSGNHVFDVALTF